MTGYGTSDWFERIYQSTDDDPWGLSWRPTQLYRYGRMLSELSRVMEDRGSRCETIVDIGCATGEFTSMLAKLPGCHESTRIVGMDLSETAINRARTKFPSLEFAVGGATEAAEEFRASADLVCCLEVIYYVSEDKRAALLAGLASMLRPGGVLLISSMISKPPYLGAGGLLRLVESVAKVRSSGVLNLRPLSELEKIALKFSGRSGRGGATRYLPGAPGYVRVDRLSAMFRKVLGRRSESHAFVIAGT